MGTVYFDPDGAAARSPISRVEFLLGGIGLLLFPDGTVQFAQSATYPDTVYSPRLSEEELEDFCAAHLAHYERYFEQNRHAIDRGDDRLPAIHAFWL